MNNNTYYPNSDNSDYRNLFSQNKGGDGNNTQISRVIDINEVDYNDHQSTVDNDNNKSKCEGTIPEKKTDTSEKLINDLLDHGEELAAKNKKLETENQKLQKQKAGAMEIICALNEKVRVMQKKESRLRDELDKVSEGSLRVWLKNEDLSNKLKCLQDENVAWKLANDELTEENKKLSDKIKMLNDTRSKSNLKSENDELKLKRESEQSAAKNNYDSFIAKIILDEEHKSSRCFVALSGCLLGLTYTILPFAISTMGMFMMGFGVLFLASSALLIYGSVKERLDKYNDDEKTTKKNFWCKKLSGLILGIGLVLLGIVGLACPGLFLSYMWSQIVSDIFYSVSIAVGAHLLKCFYAIKIPEYQQNEPEYSFNNNEKPKFQFKFMSDVNHRLDNFISNVFSSDRKDKNIVPNNIDNDYPAPQDIVKNNIVNNNIGVLPQDFFPRANSESLDNSSGYNSPKFEHVLSNCISLTD